ncbi:MAG: SAM-dependent chlorinase/fluorinase [Solirubrobacterales bacterium]|nr:SAM-dependent chlorinase/fluorinase [Solirubrobacterales bacterium]
MALTPVVTFLSDYGLTDEFVGVCHGVIARICPAAHVIDLSHGVPRHDVGAGAALLAGALPYLPVGVHLAVVDPGVGSERRAVVVQCADGRRLVGPDNGLLWPAAEASGGATRAVDIGDSPFALRPVSATFHGRDLFAPVAARLAAGADVGDAGGEFDVGDLVALTLGAARREGDDLIAPVRGIDSFGNLALGATAADLEVTDWRGGCEPGARLALALADGTELTVAHGRTFAEAPAGTLIVYEDSFGRLAVAVNLGDAAERLGLSVGDEIRIRAAR